MKKKQHKGVKFIHIFILNDAYDAAAYQQCAYKSGEVACCLIMFKAIVAPLKLTSIPQLELLGTVLHLQLEGKIARALQMEIKDVTFWCDNMSVL